jgi:transposase InsO family protein
MARYIPVSDTIDAAQLASILVHKLILRSAGVPSSIGSNRGPQFTSKFWSALSYHLKIKRRLSTAYHLLTDEQTEWQNQTLEQYLRPYINYHQSDWSRWLVFAEFAYNNSIHASIEMTPLMAAEGQHAHIQTAAPRPTSKLDGVDNPAATK